MVPGAGIEPAWGRKCKSLMAHGFWFKPSAINDFAAFQHSTPINACHQHSTRVLETVWRRQLLGAVMSA